MTTYRLKGTSGPVLNQTFPLSGTQVFGADIPVDSESDAAEITVQDGQILLLARPTGPGVQLNGESVTTASLGQGDELRIGRCRFIVQAPGLRPERVLTEDAVSSRRVIWPWIALAAAAGAAAWWAWQQGLLTF